MRLADVCVVRSSRRCFAEGRDEMVVAGDGHKLGSQLFVDEKAVEGRVWGICKHWHTCNWETRQAQLCLVGWQGGSISCFAGGPSTWIASESTEECTEYVH